MRPRFHVWIVVPGVALGGVTVARSAAAQHGTRPSTAKPAVRKKHVIVPPRLTSPAKVNYPDGAKGNAVVVLTLTVENDGSVGQPRVMSGAEPFASAAVEASRSWSFKPATRDGQPVPARIRFEVKFTQPPLPPPAPAPKPEQHVAPPPKPKKRTARPHAVAKAKGIVIDVEGEKLPPDSTTLTEAEVRQLPGAFGDPFRAIEALPGVTPIASGLPYFYVRGAPPGNVGYFLDGVRVPYLYHVGLGPSVVNPAMVDSVSLYSGGYPARFGRFTGGIVSAKTTAPRTDLHGQGTLRLFDVGGMVEDGFANNRGTVLLGGRYSYTAALLSLIAKNVQLDYRDYQARVTYDVTPRDRIGLFSFGSYDLLGQKTSSGLDTLFGSEFYRLDLRWDHRLDHGGKIRYAVTLGWDQTKVRNTQNARDQMLGARTELDQPVSKSVRVHFGADTELDHYTTSKQTYADPENPDTQRFNATFPPRDDMAMGMWLDAVTEVSPTVEVTPGARVDYFTSGGVAEPSVDVRLSGRFKVAKHVRIVHAYGIAHQAPSFIVPVPGLSPARLQGGLQTSLQTSAGVEWDLPLAIKARATLFHNAFFNMSDTLGSSTGDPIDNLTQRSLGEAYGLEVYIHRSLTKRIGGFLSYTLSRSTRSLGREKFVASFDRTHVLNVAVGYNLGRRWRAGTRLMYYTGAPKIVRSHGLVPPLRTGTPQRDPPFYRIDVRLEKRWLIERTRWLALVIECQNVTLNKETIQSTQIGPVTIPSIGLEGGF